MSAKKRSAETYASDDGFVENDASSDAEPRSKKLKNNSGAGKHAVSKPQESNAIRTDDNGDQYWGINASDTRRVTVNTFSGKTMVNIREYYEKDGKKLPGKKGISLNMEQYTALIDILPQIEIALKEKGERIPRPVYDEETAKHAESENEEAEHNNETGKRNFETTSDEDE